MFCALTIFRVLSTDKTRDEDFDTDQNEDRAAENGRFVRKFRAEFFAEEESEHTNAERDGGDDERGNERHNEFVFRYGEPDGQRVDGSRHALHEQTDEPHSRLAARVLFLILDTLDEHFSADKAEQEQSDPRDKLFKGLEISDDGMYADPADHRHQGLEEGEHARHAAHFSFSHTRFVQTVGKRHGKRVHSQSHAEQYAVKEKHKIPHCKPPKKQISQV